VQALEFFNLNNPLTAPFTTLSQKLYAKRLVPLKNNMVQILSALVVATLSISASLAAPVVDFMDIDAREP
jgi:hypothetical protein